MRVVVAMDAFKGSVSSRAAGDAAAAGICSAIHSADVTVAEIADGGEGTLDALVHANHGEHILVGARDALGNPVAARIGVYTRRGRRRAVVESAEAIGLTRVPVTPDLPTRGRSDGLADLILAARDTGAEEIMVALGGSATTDGGTGLLQALGARLRDDEGNDIGPTENPLWRFASLDQSSLPQLGDVRVSVLADVRNPLVGPDGAARVYGPQKGASAEQVHALDDALRRWGDALEASYGATVVEQPGAGAAGGIGAALLALGARMQSGFDRVAHETGLADALRHADLVLTGEGRLDAQSASGKAALGVARLAREAGSIVVALAGGIQDDPGGVSPLLDGAFPIHREPRPLAVALSPELTEREIRATAHAVASLVGAATRDTGGAHG